MSTAWIRRNMLHIDDKCDRKLTEAELKVKQSLQRLSIPDWYLNKYTSPPKLLNTKPFELRPSPWKNSSPQRKCTLNSPSSSLSDVERNLNEETRKATKMPIKKTTCHQQELPATNRKRCAPKEGEVFDTDIPMAKYPKKISRTFPKKSPSRKFWNLNLVLPPGPRINFSKEFESTYLDDAKESKALQKQTKSSKKNNATERGKQKENDVFRVPITPIEPADMEFNVCATSTPNSSFVITGPKELKRVLCDITTKDFSTSQQDSMNRAMNLLNTSKSIPKSKKLSPNILEKASIFESNSKLNNLDRSYARASSDKLLSDANIQSNSVRAKTSIFESSSSINNLNRSYTKSSSNKEKLLLPADIRETKSVCERTFIYESNSSINNAGTSSNKLPLRRNIQSTESIRAKMAIFESSVDSSDKSYIKPSINKVKPLPAKNNRSTNSGTNNRSYVGTSSESLNIRSSNSSTRSLTTPMFEHPPILVRELVRQLEDPRPPRSKARNRSPDAVRSSINIEGKMFDKELLDTCPREKRSNFNEEWSYAKFLGLRKNPARRGKQSTREGNTIQEITRLFEKARISRRKRGSGLTDSFVMELADALERKDMSAIKKITRQDEEDSCTESYVTSTFPQDTNDSLDGCDQQPSTAICNDVESITTTMGKLTVKEETEQKGDDVVYWIPIRQRKIPRSSSLLSIISKLSSNGYSPCISPIKSEDEVELSQRTKCETPGKENVAKKLFKIDETVVIDSGYSDRSERSVLNSVPSAANNTWHDDFEPERGGYIAKMNLHETIYENVR
ncbi:hypothetical protein QLX08_001586 [Tetragonisca angustula]|uniref:Uncharacterized protein n=1 Tax=Tetragonisca angustula TaxID=166442 RepID=A0AAW1AH55_9HYME